MTTRQFVRKFYPNAILDYHVMPRNTMAPRTWYEIRSDEHGKIGHKIGGGSTRKEAWASAKIRIMSRNPEMVDFLAFYKLKFLFIENDTKINPRDEQTIGDIISGLRHTKKLSDLNVDYLFEAHKIDLNSDAWRIKMTEHDNFLLYTHFSGEALDQLRAMLELCRHYKIRNKKIFVLAQLSGVNSLIEHYADELLEMDERYNVSIYFLPEEGFDIFKKEYHKD